MFHWCSFSSKLPEQPSILTIRPLDHITHKVFCQHLRNVTSGGRRLAANTFHPLHLRPQTPGWCSGGNPDWDRFKSLFYRGWHLCGCIVIFDMWIDRHDVLELYWLVWTGILWYTHRYDRIIVGTTLEAIISIGILCEWLRRKSFVPGSGSETFC